MLCSFVKSTERSLVRSVRGVRNIVAWSARVVAYFFYRFHRSAATPLVDVGLCFGGAAVVQLVFQICF